MSDLVNLVKALLGSMFDVCFFKAKNRLFEFDRCSKNDVGVRLMFDEMVFVMLNH